MVLKDFQHSGYIFRFGVRGNVVAAVFNTGRHAFGGKLDARYPQIEQDDTEARFKRFTGVLGGLGAAKWTLATYFPFIRFPGEHFFLKPTLTQNAAMLCRFDLGYRPEPNRVTYRRLLAFARVLSEVIGELEPADMFDLQAFVSCLAQVKR